MEYYSAIETNETESFAVTWTDLESVIHSEASLKDLWSHLRGPAGLKKKKTNKHVLCSKTQRGNRKMVGGLQSRHNQAPYHPNGQPTKWRPLYYRNPPLSPTSCFSAG